MNIHALWCHPRSVSTAFERIMRERGDLTVLHEPFMYEFYLNQSHRPFADFTPDPDHPTSYEAIREMIRAKAATRPVFFKDMAYYVLHALPDDRDFMAGMSHSFLVRDPVESALSYAKRDPDFTSQELGIEGQWQLYEALRQAGQSPQVILSSDLRADPAATLSRYWQAVGLCETPEALSWGSAVPDGWETVEAWHKDVLQSGAIRAPETTRDYAGELAALGGPFSDYAAHHRAFYDQLAEVAEAQKMAAQK